MRQGQLSERELDFFLSRKKIVFHENDSMQEPEAERGPEGWRREVGLGVRSEGEKGTKDTGCGG